MNRDKKDKFRIQKIIKDQSWLDCNAYKISNKLLWFKSDGSKEIKQSLQLENPPIRPLHKQMFSHTL